MGDASRHDHRESRGRLFVGTSGFAYPGWAPLFYPAGLRGDGLLRHYAARLPSVELNNTFYRQPTPAPIAAWLSATPPAFRFAVKAQRGGAFRALRGADPRVTLDWLLAPYRHFGERLGTVLVRAGEESPRDDEALGRLLEAWPPDIPVAFELQHPSWEMDEVHALLRAGGAALVATDLDDRPPPDLRRLAPFLYLRLRRSVYDEANLEAWAARLEPFLADGVDAFVFFRHDADGTSALRAQVLRDLLARVAA